jgi:hypothetical protein
MLCRLLSVEEIVVEQLTALAQLPLITGLAADGDLEEDCLP